MLNIYFMDTITNRFEWGSRMLLYVLAAFLPLAVLPLSLRVDFGREIIFSTLVIAAAVLWLLSILTVGEVRIRHSPVCWAALALLLVFGAATIFSKSPFVSFLISDVAAESLVTLMAAALLMLLTSSVFRSREEAGMLIFILIFAGALSALFTLIQIWTGFTPYRWLVNSATSIDFNVVGTINGLALFYIALFMMTLGVLYSTFADNWKEWVRYALWAALAFFALNIIFINFRIGWGVMLASAIVAFGFVFMNVRLGGRKLDWRYAFAIFLIVVSVVMLIMQTPLVQLAFPAEVSPTMGSTFKVAQAVWGEGTKSLLLGSGPGTFGLDWNFYKDPSINQNIFWGLRFNQGFSWASTVLATAGILGFLAMLVFLLSAAAVYLRAELTATEEERPFSLGAFLGFVALLASVFVYPANFTLTFGLFLLAGILAVFLGRESSVPGFMRADDSAESGTDSAVERRGFWDVKEYLVRLESPWLVFVSSLLVIVFLSLGVAALYAEVIRVRSALARERGVAALNSGNTDNSISEFEQAVLTDQRNFRNYQALLQARTEKLKTLIQRAAGGENVQQDFQAQLALAIQNAQRATELNPREPLAWRARAAFYEVMIPFIPGSERLAFEGYQRASELDPINPSIYTDWGRAGLVYADRLLLLANQSSGEARENLVKSRVSILQEIEKVLEKAVLVKQNFATAHFLAAQTAIRLGNLQSAIRATENAKATAPFDIGVAFQLGLLYYQANDIDKSQIEFERAVSLDQNYSNARYFLGLIYDRKGDKPRALEQFERIEALNPGNAEVKIILRNLRGGTGALSGIVPPAEPPERRREAPVVPSQ